MGTIYSLTNKISDEVYIGQTERDVNIRFAEHKSKALNGASSKLHRAMKADGVDNFELRIIEDNIPVNQLNEREVYWIAYYCSDSEGYNSTVGGMHCNIESTDNLRRYDYAQVELLWREGLTREQISLKMGCNPGTVSRILHIQGVSREQRMDRAITITGITVFQISPNGKIENEFLSINAAAKYFEVVPSSIRRAIDYNGTCLGYFWKVAKSISAEDIENGYYSGELIVPRTNNAIINGSPLWKLDAAGNLLERFDYLAEAATSVSGLPSNIQRALGGNGTAYGWFWIYESDISIEELKNAKYLGCLHNLHLQDAVFRGIPVVSIDPKTNRLCGWFYSEKEACKCHGRANGSVRYAIKNNTKSAGLYWKTEELYVSEIKQIIRNRAQQLVNIPFATLKKMADEKKILNAETKEELIKNIIEAYIDYELDKISQFRITSAI